LSETETNQFKKFLSELKLQSEQNKSNGKLSGQNLLFEPTVLKKLYRLCNYLAIHLSSKHV